MGSLASAHSIGIDGEMIVLDGHFYHARSDGSVEESRDSELALLCSCRQLCTRAEVPGRQHDNGGA